MDTGGTAGEQGFGGAQGVDEKLGSMEAPEDSKNGFLELNDRCRLKRDLGRLL